MSIEFKSISKWVKRNPIDIFIFGFFVSNLFLLAINPQNPDGAEIVAAAEPMGGVLHSPGYPLQGWIGKFLALVPFGTLCERLSFSSLVFFSGALFTLSRFLKRQELGSFSVAMGVGFFGFFPSVWYLSVQPEKFGLAYLLLSLVLFFAFDQKWMTDLRKWSPSIRPEALFGLLCGLCLVQHPLSLAYAPIMGWGAWSIFKSSKAKQTSALLLVSWVLVPMCLLYLSLFLLARGAVWPNWGEIRSLHDLWSLVTRKDFQNATALEFNENLNLFGVVLGARLYWDAFGVALTLVPLGIWAFLKSQGRVKTGVVLATLLLLIFGLVSIRTSVDFFVRGAYEERYFSLLTPVVALFPAFGSDFILRLMRPQVRRGVQWGFVVILLSFFIFNRPIADARSDQTAKVFTEALEQTLPQDAVWFSGTHLETFYGIRTSSGARRFPIHPGPGWVNERLIPLIEPRLASGISPNEPQDVLAAKAHQAGFSVATSLASLLVEAKLEQIPLGLISIAPGKNSIPIGPQTWREISVKLCDLFSSNPNIFPGYKHSFSEHLYEWFPFAFGRLAGALYRAGEVDRAKDLALVQATLQQRKHSELKDACAVFKKNSSEKK